MLLSLLTICAVHSVILRITANINKRAKPTFNIETKGQVTSHSITEASGICASRIHNDVLYTHNDSGDANRIFAISITTGKRLGTVKINGAHSQDWEDIACGPCPNVSDHCIYIADTGGNAGGDANTIYRIREPAEIHDFQAVNLDSKLKFSWDQHNCETIMVDSQGEGYLISKVPHGHHPKLVHLPSSAWGKHHNVFVSDGVRLSITSPKAGPVSGVISPNGKEVVVKTYDHIYYWTALQRDYEGTMTTSPSTLPLHYERQGEAVCWDVNGSGYYTFSEGSGQHIYYYRRTGHELVG